MMIGKKLPLLLCFLALLVPSLVYAKTLEQPVYRPMFETTQGQVDAGTAFVITHKGKQYAVSAHHLLGLAGGLDKDYLGKDMPTLFKSVTLNPVQQGHEPLTSATAVKIEQAESLTDQTLVHDIFMAELENASAKPFPLAKSLPKVGEVVYVYAKLVSGSKALLHKAVVIFSDENELGYAFVEKVNLRATSGAALLNSNHEVVGINLAGGAGENGQTIGWANPVNSIKLHLLSAKDKQKTLEAKANRHKRNGQKTHRENCGSRF